MADDFKKRLNFLRLQTQRLACQAENFVFSKHCMACGKLLDIFKKEDFCSCCGEEIEELSAKILKNPYKGSTVAIYSYKKSIRKAIHSFKYHNQRRIGLYFAFKLIPLILNNDEFKDIDLICYIPCYKFKNGREYNQAEFLAKKLSLGLNLKLGKDVLKKKSNIKSQSRCKNYAQRFENAKKAFRIAKKSLVHDKHILLVDDIYTTGATTGTCAELLLSAGAKKVSLAIIAKTPKEYNKRKWQFKVNINSTAIPLNAGKNKATTAEKIQIAYEKRQKIEELKVKLEKILEKFL